MDEENVRSGFRIRVVVSTIITFAWLIYAIIHAVFLWGHFSTFQNITILVITFFLGLAIIGVMWCSWGGNMCNEYCEYMGKMKNPEKE